MSEWVLRWRLFLALVLVGMAGGLPGAEARQGLEESACEGCVRIDAIVIEGLLRTRREVVERELVFQEGDRASAEDVQLSVQRLRNMGIFRSVDYELQDRRIAVFGEDRDQELEADDGRLLHIRVDERWTISPSLSFGQGGETFRLSVGLQDANLWGSYLQAGGRYSRQGETNSFSTWFRNPRFWNKRQSFRVSAEFNNRLHSIYRLDGQLLGGYLLNRRGGGISLGKDWTDWVTSGIHASFSADSFSYEMVPDARRQAQEARGGLPATMQSIRLGLSAAVGRIDRIDYRYRGTQAGTRIDQYFHFGDVAPRSNRMELTLRHFSELPWKSNLALRGVLAFSDIDAESMQFHIGGLDSLRGTVDMRYRGSNYWLGNIEYRIPSFERSWVVLQHIFFIDAVGVRRHASSPAALTAATTGLGLRIISPSIHGLLIRVDYALPILGADGPALSVGAGQFF